MGAVEERARAYADRRTKDIRDGSTKRGLWDLLYRDYLAIASEQRAADLWTAKGAVIGALTERSRECLASWRETGSPYMEGKADAFDLASGMVEGMGIEVSADMARGIVEIADRMLHECTEKGWTRDEYYGNVARAFTEMMDRGRGREFEGKNGAEK